MENEQSKSKRVFRTNEERIAEIDKKIAYHQQNIDSLEEQKKKIGQPRARRSNSSKELLNAIKESGKTMDEILAFVKSQE